jgi:DNA polymerase alpha-associated DNA helicase A
VLSPIPFSLKNLDLTFAGKRSLVELERPAAYHTSPIFPPHNFRPGDLARIEANVSSAGPSKKTPKKPTETKGSQAEGVVYRVCFDGPSHGC